MKLRFTVLLAGIVMLVWAGWSIYGYLNQFRPEPIPIEVLSPTTTAPAVVTTTSTSPVATQPDRTTSTSTTSTTVPAEVYGRPTHLTIEKIGVDDELMPIGLGPEGEFEAEPMTVAWYQGSVWPGQTGPMLLAAHVAWKELGPDRFARLTELRPGNQFQLANELGEVFTYTVTDLYEVNKETEFSEFINEVVYADTGNHAAWLITCGGDLLPTGHFGSNIFVRATLSPEEG